MRSSSRLFVRTLLIPGFVLLLGLAAIASITVLQDEAHDSADAQAKLARMETDLAALQIAPFQASERTGGSPEMGRRLIDTLKRSIDAALADLLRDSPPPALRGITAPLRANYATYEQIYAIGVRGEYGRAADALAGKANGGTAQIGRLIVQADGTYRRRADTADTRATIGSAIVILLLVAAFGFLYRRAVGARLTAERLVAENARLLAGSRVEALTDALTALPNRRSLTQDLDDAVGLARGGREHVLAMFDLDGFKQYNDTFGHPAGDALLARLGGRLRAAVSERGTAYRIGGDEFCVLAAADADGGLSIIMECAEALTETGEAFHVGCSFGRVTLPDEANSAEAALQLADQRMYDEKASRASSSRQSADVLLTVLNERNPDLMGHIGHVSALAEAVARGLDLPEPAVKWVRVAAELHDIGKMAIPDAILNKPGPLSDDEWAFMRRHTLIGERIISAAPSLVPAARLVRSSHERFDGQGYPDGLAGEEIDVGASIIAVCDAYDAMVDDRVYSTARSPQAALVELRKCAGTQFDPAVVDAFCATVDSSVRSRLVAVEPIML